MSPVPHPPPAHVYIAAPLHLLSVARFVAGQLRERGMRVVSEWHTGTPSEEGEATLSTVEQGEIATGCLQEIDHADAVLVLYGEQTHRHGHALEAGYAMARGALVVAAPVSGSAVLPTLLLRHPSVAHCESVGWAVDWLAERMG